MIFVVGFKWEKIYFIAKELYHQGPLKREQENALGEHGVLPCMLTTI